MGGTVVRITMVAALLSATAAVAQEARLALRISPELTLAAEAPARAVPAVAPAITPPEPASRSSMGDYRIGAEDLIEIQVFGVDQLARTVRVNTFGMVSLPLIGAVAVGGMTAQEAERLIARRLAADFLQDPQVSVFIKEYTNQRVTVEGAVNRPGIYPLRGQTTLLRTLALAGGQGQLSDMNNVVLFRNDASGKRETRVFDVERIRRGELEDPQVVNDDVIVVNRSAARTALKDSLFRDVIDAINPFSTPFVPR